MSIFQQQHVNLELLHFNFYVFYLNSCDINLALLNMQLSGTQHIHGVAYILPMSSSKQLILTKVHSAPVNQSLPIPSPHGRLEAAALSLKNSTKLAVL